MRLISLCWRWLVMQFAVSSVIQLFLSNLPKCPFIAGQIDSPRMNGGVVFLRLGDSSDRMAGTCEKYLFSHQLYVLGM